VDGCSFLEIPGFEPVKQLCVRIEKAGLALASYTISWEKRDLKASWIPEYFVHASGHDWRCLTDGA
jgi:hypothetical protein